MVVILVSKWRRDLPFPKALDTNICDLCFNTGPILCLKTHLLIDVPKGPISAFKAGKI
jgi:hypothetical protein